MLACLSERVMVSLGFEGLHLLTRHFDLVLLGFYVPLRCCASYFRHFKNQNDIDPCGPQWSTESMFASYLNVTCSVYPDPMIQRSAY